ncbi:MAG: lysophospholipid acyltransferase family protein [Gemmataceae bacterium]
MSLKHSRSAQYTVYLAVRFLVCVLQMLPLSWAAKLAEGLAWLAYRVDRRHRLVAIENLRQAFPERCADDEECQALVRAVYRHFCLMIVEILHLPRQVHPNNWRRFFTMRGGDVMIDSMLAGRPMLFVTAHFGNWEIGGYMLGLLGFTSSAIARPLDNPYLDRYFGQFRQRNGQRILAKKGDYDQIQQVLRQGGVLATLGDQDAGQRGLFVNFFGRPASTHKAIALLAIEHKVPLVVVAAIRTGGLLQYEIVIEDVIEPEDFTDRPNAVRVITERFTDALERLVRAAPEQYLWLHRRWKHQPARQHKQGTRPKVPSA